MSSIDRPNCRKCGRPAKLRRNKTSNGLPQVGWYCLDCQCWAVMDKPFIQKAKAEQIVSTYGKSFDDIPIVADWQPEPCIICGKAESETHHFAPQELADRFDNWTAWPTASLCTKHHTQWHELVQGRKIR